MNRLAVVVSHPIQYYAPLWRALAAAPGLELHVIFATRIGLDKTFDAEMNTQVAWATDLTGGYTHEFLPEAPRFTHTGFHVDNPSVGAALSRFKPDAVLLHGYGSRTLLRALVWSKRHGVRALLTADSSGGSGGWRGRMRRAALPWLLARYDALLTMGDRSEAYFAELGVPRTKMFRLPTMMDEAFWRARRDRDALRVQTRATLGIAPDAFVVLAAAKLSPRKRIGDLLAAAREMTLLIAGEGEQGALLRAQAGPGTRFLGFVNIDALPALYAAADVFAHPAEVEPYGMVLVEAALLGLPLVATQETGAVGPTAIARANVNTLVYRAGDVAALGFHLARLRDDVALREAMSRESLLLSEQHAGPASVAAVLAAAGFAKATPQDLPKS